MFYAGKQVYNIGKRSIEMKRALFAGLITIFILSQFCIAIDGKWHEYNARSKNSLIAGALAYVPSIGHLYAGDWQRSFPFLIADGIGLGILIAGNKSGIIDPGMGTAGALTIGVAQIWAMIDAYNTAEEYNKELRVELGLESM